MNMKGDMPQCPIVTQVEKPEPPHVSIFKTVPNTIMVGVRFKAVKRIQHKESLDYISCCKEA